MVGDGQPDGPSASAEHPAVSFLRQHRRSMHDQAARLARQTCGFRPAGRSGGAPGLLASVPEVEEDATAGRVAAEQEAFAARLRFRPSVRRQRVRLGYDRLTGADKRRQLLLFVVRRSALFGARQSCKRRHRWDYPHSLPCSLRADASPKQGIKLYVRACETRNWTSTLEPTYVMTTRGAQGKRASDIVVVVGRLQ